MLLYSFYYHYFLYIFISHFCYFLTKYYLTVFFIFQVVFFNLWIYQNKNKNPNKSQKKNKRGNNSLSLLLGEKKKTMVCSSEKGKWEGDPFFSLARDYKNFVIFRELEKEATTSPPSGSFFFNEFSHFLNFRISKILYDATSSWDKKGRHRISKSI